MGVSFFIVNREADLVFSDGKLDIKERDGFFRNGMSKFESRMKVVDIIDEFFYLVEGSEVAAIILSMYLRKRCANCPLHDFIQTWQ